MQVKKKGYIQNKNSFDFLKKKKRKERLVLIDRIIKKAHLLRIK